MPFRTLGLDESADELALRRAYARLLKQNRPDDDPVAFQRLHEAYQACLAQVRRRQPSGQVIARDDGEREGALAPDPAGLLVSSSPVLEGALDRADAAPVSPPAAPLPGETVVLSDGGAVDTEVEPGLDLDLDETYFDLGAFLAELFERIENEPASALDAWLSAHPNLYSIRLKSAIVVDVLSAVTEHEPPVPVDRVDVIAAFFAVDTLGPQDWWLVEQLDTHRTASRTRDQFRNGQLPRGPSNEEQRYFDKLIDREIAQPRWRWRMAWLFFIAGIPTRIHNRILELDQLTDGAASELANPRLKQLADRLSDRASISPWRLGLTWLRVLLFTTLALGLVYVFSDTVEFGLIEFGLICGAVFTGWQIGLAGYLALKRGIERRGQGHLFREASAVVLAATALAIDVFSTAIPRSAAYLLMVISISRAVTVMRFHGGYLLALVFGASDWLMTALGYYPNPFSPMLLGLALTTVVVIALDRIQVRRSGLPIEAVLAGDSWLKRGAAVALLGVTAALIIGAAVFLV